MAEKKTNDKKMTKQLMLYLNAQKSNNMYKGSSFGSVAPKGIKYNNFVNSYDTHNKMIQGGGGYGKFSDTVNSKISKYKTSTEESKSKMNLMNAIDAGVDSALQKHSNSLSGYVNQKVRPVQQVYMNANIPQFGHADANQANPFNPKYKDGFNRSVIVSNPIPYDMVGSANIDHITKRVFAIKLNQASIGSRRYYYQNLRPHLIANESVDDGEYLVSIAVTGDPRDNSLLKRWAVTDRELTTRYPSIHETTEQLQVFTGKAPPGLYKRRIVGAKNSVSCHLRYYVLDSSMIASLGFSGSYYRVMDNINDFKKLSSAERIKKRRNAMAKITSKLIMEPEEKKVNIDYNFYALCNNILNNPGPCCCPNLPYMYTWYTTQDGSIPTMLKEFDDKTKFRGELDPFDKRRRHIMRQRSLGKSKVPALMIMTEGSVELATWMEEDIKVNHESFLEVSSGYHTIEEWISVIFQWVWALAILDYHQCKLNLDETNVRVVPTLQRKAENGGLGENNGHWLYMYKAQHFFVQNLGHRAIIDASMKIKKTKTTSGDAKNYIKCLFEIILTTEAKDIHVDRKVGNRIHRILSPPQEIKSMLQVWISKFVTNKSTIQSFKEFIENEPLIIKHTSHSLIGKRRHPTLRLSTQPFATVKLTRYQLVLGTDDIWRYIVGRVIGGMVDCIECDYVTGCYIKNTVPTGILTMTVGDPITQPHAPRKTSYGIEVKLGASAIDMYVWN